MTKTLSANGTAADDTRRQVMMTADNTSIQPKKRVFSKINIFSDITKKIEEVRAETHKGCF